MTVEANAWNKNSSSWREWKDSATVTVDVSVNHEIKMNVADGSVTYAKIQNVSASPRILGRKTAGAGVIEECTLSEVLDFIGSAAQGDILYRGASAWARLGAGTNLQFLQTQGTSANPQWANGGTVLLTSGTVSSAATLDLVLTSYTGYRGLIFELMNFIPATDNVSLLFRVSTNGGSSYDSSAGNYMYAGITTASNSDTVFGSDRSTSATSITTNVRVGNGSSEGCNLLLRIMDQANTAIKPKISYKGEQYEAADLLSHIVGFGLRNTAQDTDAVRFLFSSGNISSGKYAVYGLL